MALTNNASSWISYGGTSALPAASDWSCSVIIAPTVNTGSDATIVSKRNGFSSGTNQYQIALGDGNNRKPALTKDDKYILWDATLSLSTEYVLTFTATASIARVWVNGSEITSVSVSNQGASANWQTGAAAGSANIEVFSYNGGSDVVRATVSELALWSAALTDAEVQSLYRHFKPSKIRPQSLSMYWDFVGGSLRELRRGYSSTPTGTWTTTAHPRVY